MTAYSAILNDPAKYKLQIIYTKIDRDKNNHPHFTEYMFNVSNAYVYPASTVKLPVALLALIKLRQLNIHDLTPASIMFTDSTYNCHKRVYTDTTSRSRFPSLENYIKKMFLVSDNEAFARTFEFAGYDYMHENLSSWGFENIRLFNRLNGACAGDTAKILPAVYFLNTVNDTLYRQQQSKAALNLKHPIENSTLGTFHQKNGKWVAGPKDFSQHNYLQPSDLHRLMQKIVFNDLASKKDKLPVNGDDREFMLKALGKYPRESECPKYDSKIYYDAFKKYFIYGAKTRTIAQDSLRVINIVGRAYGFLTDCAYIVDFKNKIEFLVTATIYVNAGGKIGSGKYEYEQTGLPFLKSLGLSLYKFELKRKKDFLPDLSSFKKLF